MRLPYLVLLASAAVSLCAIGCDESDSKPTPDAGPPPPPMQVPQRMSLAELQNPETCASCHPKQYDQWRGSMHAYAADDPVFIAMNKRGQRETNGSLGDFCVKCHAPMAVSTGATKDGLNLDTLAKPMKGVTCYFCHNATDAGPDHFNNSLTLANDDVMRGSIRNPVEPGVHGAAYSESHDSRSMKASYLCGSCHDVKNQKGVHIERTLAEYEATIHSLARSGNNGGDSCQGCHMPWQETGKIAEPPASLGYVLPDRDRHDHRWPAVDVALTDFPNRDQMKHATECALTQDGAYIFSIEFKEEVFKVSIETTAGHAQPSGTAQDRRFWLEAIAYDANNNVLFQSGVIADDELEEHPAGDPKWDSQLCMFRDHFSDENKKEVHMFWEAAEVNPLTSRLLPIAVDSLSNHVATCEYKVPGRQTPARFTFRMRMRPVGIDVLQNLVDSGDLDPAIIKQMPTFTLHSTSVEWTPKDGSLVQLPPPKPWPITCP